LNSVSEGSGRWGTAATGLAGKSRRLDGNGTPGNVVPTPGFGRPMHIESNPLSQLPAASSPDLSIVIATWNEIGSLPALVRDIRARLPDAWLLVVDDSSPDGTGQWVRELQRTDPRVDLLTRPVREGLGRAAIAGLERAMTFGTEWIATMDADQSHDPADLAALVRRAARPDNKADVLIGSRYVPGGRVAEWGWHRRTASRLVNLVVQKGLGLKYRDNSSALRLYRRTALARIPLGRVDCGSHVYLEQILLHLHRSGARIEEYPVTFRDRRAGRSSLTVRSLTPALYEFARLLAFRR
jgi:glycosyltransferase involved in cell wall biosynthesis